MSAQNDFDFTNLGKDGVDELIYVVTLSTMDRLIEKTGASGWTVITTMIAALVVNFHENEGREATNKLLAVLMEEEGRC